MKKLIKNLLLFFQHKSKITPFLEAGALDLFTKENINLIIEGERINFPTKYWTTLLFAYKLFEKGIIPSWDDAENVTYKYNEISITTSAIDGSVADTLIEAFITDEYRLENINMENKVVLDIGANIGDMAVSFIKKSGFKSIFV